METCLFDIRDKFTFPYLGDIMAYSEDFRSHLDHLWIVFRPLKERNIKINSAKCKFFQKAVNFLRRVISGDEYKIDSKNINAVKYLAATPSKPSMIYGICLDYLAITNDMERTSQR